MSFSLGIDTIHNSLLVVNSTRGEFEIGFDQGGQTREHTMLLCSIGNFEIRNII